MKKFYEVQMIDVKIPFEDCEICEAGAVLSPWMDSIPYGSDNDKTCKEILNEVP